MVLPSRAKEDWKIESVIIPDVKRIIEECSNIYQGKPEWLKDEVKTLNFAKTVSEELANLAMLGTSVKVEGTKGDYLQEKVDKLYYDLPEWIEYALAYGIVILKPNEDGVDLVLPNDFIITATKDKEIIGIVFKNKPVKDAENGKWYIRYEYHHFDDEEYIVENKCFMGVTENSQLELVAIENTPFKALKDYVSMGEMKKPLFAVLTAPGANNIIPNSVARLPIFNNAIEELHDLDIAYNRYSEEIDDSQRMVLLDADRLLPGKGTTNNPEVQKITRKRMELPKYVRNVGGGEGTNDFYQEINPTLNTATRIEGINFYLSVIGGKSTYRSYRCSCRVC